MGTIGTVLSCVLWAAMLAGEQPAPVAAAAPVSVTRSPYDLAVERVQRLMSVEALEWPRAPVVETPRSSLPARPASAQRVLTETAQAEDAATRLRGLEGLAQTAGIEHVDTFIAALSDAAPEIRDLAARTLVQLDPAVVSEKIMAVLCSGNSDSIVRMDVALPSLKEVLEPRMIGVLQTDDESALRKQAAAYCLGRMNSVSAVAALNARIWASEPDVAVACANALTAIRDPVVLPMLIELTRHPIPEIRWPALQALADIGGPEALDALTRVAIAPPEDDEAIGRRAIQLLGATKNQAAVPLLIEVMRRNVPLRRAAVEALHQITGEDLGDRPSDWLAWYQEQQKRANEPPPPQDNRLPWDVEYLPE